MKKAIIFLTVLAFSSQAFSVAMTASPEARANTRAIENDCSQTQNINVLRNCALQKAYDEELKAKKKEEQFKILASAFGAGIAIWPFVKSKLAERMDHAASVRDGGEPAAEADGLDGQ